MVDHAYYLDICSYRCLFDKHIGGKQDGNYVDLDFAYLVDLWQIDRVLRHTLLPLTLDIEHFAKAKIVAKIAEHEGEDGYTIVSDYLNSLDTDSKARRKSDIERLNGDPYSGSLTRKYANDMPAWVAIKLWSFGSFIDFYRFCAMRWNDAEMKQEHYLLRFVRSARNGYAHSACTLIDLGKADSHLQTQIQVMSALVTIGLSKNSRKSKMRCSSIQQIATIIYTYSIFVKDKTIRQEATNALEMLKRRMNEHCDYYDKNDVIRSSFDFLKRVFEII